MVPVAEFTEARDLIVRERMSQTFDNMNHTYFKFNST